MLFFWVLYKMSTRFATKMCATVRAFVFNTVQLSWISNVSIQEEIWYEWCTVWIHFTYRWLSIREGDTCLPAASVCLHLTAVSRYNVCLYIYTALFAIILSVCRADLLCLCPTVEGESIKHCCNPFICLSIICLSLALSETLNINSISPGPFAF